MEPLNTQYDLFTQSGSESSYPPSTASNNWREGSETDPTESQNLDRMHLLNLETLVDLAGSNTDLDTMSPSGSTMQLRPKPICARPPPSKRKRRHTADRARTNADNRNSAETDEGNWRNSPVPLSSIAPAPLVSNNNRPCVSFQVPERQANEQQGNNIPRQAQAGDQIPFPPGATVIFRRNRASNAAEIKARIRATFTEAMEQRDLIPKWAFYMEALPTYLGNDDELEGRMGLLAIQHAKERMQAVTQHLSDKHIEARDMANSLHSFLQGMFTVPEDWTATKSLLVDLAARDRDISTVRSRKKT
jgi:hypothetical protein